MRVRHVRHRCCRVGNTAWVRPGTSGRLARMHAHHGAAESPTPARDWWEERYAEQDGVWSGRANAVLADIASALPVGRALDLGCGEGGDVVWLAREGWDATGVDLS